MGNDTGAGGGHGAHGFRVADETLLNEEDAIDGDVVEAQPDTGYPMPTVLSPTDPYVIALKEKTLALRASGRAELLGPVHHACDADLKSCRH
jgi:hypothetical protein